MLTRFVARGYRNLDTEVELGRCTVIVGPNNCGKSNLMRAVGFASDGARTSEQTSWAQVVRQHGANSLVNRRLRATDEWKYGEAFVSLEWTMVGDHFEWSHQLRLEEARGEQPVIAVDRSTATAERTGTQITSAFDGGHATIEVTTRRLAVSVNGSGAEHPVLGVFLPVGTEADPKALVERCRSLQRRARDELRNQRHVSLADLSPRGIAAPYGETGTGLDLLPDARNLAAHLRHLENEHPEGLGSIMRALQDLVPGLSRIWVKSPEGSGATWVELVNGDGSTPLRDASDGTIVALLLATLLHGPQRRSLLMLDEPELNLHPAWLKVVARWLQAPAAAEQVLFSTHSTDLLDALTDGFKRGEVAVLVADPATGFKNLKPDALATFFDQGYELGDLYRIGEPELGGWPW